MRGLSTLRSLLRDARGLAVTEFALIAPVFLLLLLGALDIGHTLYMQAVLQGVVQKTARDSSLESATEQSTRDTLDDTVRQKVYALNKTANVDIQRVNYYTYTKAAQATAEPMKDDIDHNGVCNPGDTYWDNNNNGNWDRNGGDTGQGGTQSAVVYTVTVDYPRLFPILSLIRLVRKDNSPVTASTTKLVAQTVLTNQPYGKRADEPTPVARACPT